MTPLKIALALLCALPAVPQDAAPKGPACDLATLEDAVWCSKCRKPREKEQLDGTQCKDCRTETEKLKVCVKKWIPRCGMHEQKPHLENCCKSKKCCVLEASKSPLEVACGVCGKSAREEAKIVHEGKEHEAKPVRRCELSGTAPHGGEPIR
jgi:hypothetical protein